MTTERPDRGAPYDRDAALELAALIRRVDGKHSLGAGALADHIIEAGYRLPALAAQPSAEPSAEPGLDVRRVAKAVENVAKRHGIVKDPPVPLAVMRIWGYSAAPLEMDAEIAAEYAALTPDRPTP